jgi:hydroxyethylthiazole kinase-like uncharacterized protein yjeF
MRSEGGLAYLTAEEMSEVDKAAIGGLGMSVESLMENAGTKTAELARMLLGGDVSGKRVAVLVGRGNNGGDGLVAARHLHNWGGDVLVVIGEGREALRDVPARQLATVEGMGVRTSTPDAELRADLIVDALLGYGAKGDPREPLARLIRRANGTGVHILAVDVPSGLDATTGEPGDPCIEGRTTVTFGLPKMGFLNPRARQFVGGLYVADISLPRAVYEKYSCQGIFSKGSLVRVW